METCYRHPDRETNVSCSRCERPICPDCMTPSPVGMRCPECAGDKTQVRRPAYGGTLSEVAPATYALIAINVVVFVAQMLGGSNATSFGGGGTLLDHGALCANGIADGGFCGIQLTEGGEFWRIATSGFMHGGLIHLGLNMFVLYLLGRLLEPALGTPRFVGLYLISLLAGSVGALWLAEPAQNTVGASGAIYGIFAATLVVARSRGMDQIVGQLGLWLGINLLLTFTVPNISIGGHLGGLAGGALAAYLLVAAESRGSSGRSSGAEIALMAATCAGLFAAGIVVAGAVAGT